MIEWKDKAIALAKEGYSWRKIAKMLSIPKSTVSDALRKYFKDGFKAPDTKANGPKVLFLDIETKYITTMGWGLFNQNFSTEQINEDWSILSFSAKWQNSSDVIYYDISDRTEDDLLKLLHSLLDDADFVVAHNGKRFDMKKIRARMVARGFKPYSPVRVIDTLTICKKEFNFTSNKLMYLTDLLCKKHKKSSHNRFPGFLLWKEAVKGNPEAFKEMREYNIIDVLSLQELYEVIAPWSSNLPVFDVYTDSLDMSEWEESGYTYTNLGKYQQYRNVKTGQYRRGRTNLLSKEKSATLLANII